MRTVLVNLLSQSIGDSIAATPYVSEFQKKKKIKVYYSINDSLIFLLESSYPNLNFIGRNVKVESDEIINLEYIFFKSIQGGYAEQLGFEDPEYIRPVIKLPASDRSIKNKYVVLGVHSTAQLKYWNHPNGIRVQEESIYWNELSSMLRKEGYTPVTVERDELFGVPPFRNGVPPKSNKKIGLSLIESINLISHCDFYIGLSSGMSWVAHALGKKIVMISNFTEDWNEFDLNLPDYIRISNKKVCHGCWNKINIEYPFDPKDWYWCPRHKGTERQFECHKTITPQMVMDQIKPFL
jgi:autotransporter strand-loop-strand O-heptosyltransferase